MEATPKHTYCAGPELRKAKRVTHLLGSTLATTQGQLPRAWVLLAGDLIMRRNALTNAVWEARHDVDTFRWRGLFLLGSPTIYDHQSGLAQLNMSMPKLRLVDAKHAIAEEGAAPQSLWRIVSDVTVKASGARHGRGQGRGGGQAVEHASYVVANTVAAARADHTQTTPTRVANIGGKRRRCGRRRRPLFGCRP